MHRIAVIVLGTLWSVVGLAGRGRRRCQAYGAPDEPAQP